MLDIEYGKDVDVHIKVKVERSNENLRVLHPKVIKCNFEDERNLKSFKLYSRQFCILECMQKNEECNPIEIPRKEISNDSFCDASWPANPYVEFEYRHDDECKCYPSCNFMQFEVTKKVNEFDHKANYTTELTFFEDDLLAGNFYIQENEKFLTYTLINCEKI